ncbi:hypothetical protein JCM19233_4797 [Vibrio astriarenae]|nr:hypothetical protein JCM19233_4797 [Vibrio sp. C7]
MYQSRRFDGDFLTINKLISQGKLEVFIPFILVTTVIDQR